MGKKLNKIDIKKEILSEDWINHPHDKFFKIVFSEIENTIDFISKIFPTDVVNLLNLNSLKLEKDSFLDEKLKNSFSDLVFSIKLKTKNKIKISLLFEHKTKQSDDIYIQLLTYLLNFYKTIKKGKKLELIIPIIVYHGKNEWKRKEFSEYFNFEDENLKRFIPNFDYILSDLSTYTDEDIHSKKFNRAELETALLLMKNIYDVKKIMKNLPEYLQIIKSLLDAEDKYIMTIFTYLINTIDVDYKEIAKEIKKASKKGGDLAMTAAQRILGLIDKGKADGMLKGISKGISKGKAERNKELVVNMFNENMRIDDISRFTGLSKNEIEIILKIN